VEVRSSEMMKSTLSLSDFPYEKTVSKQKAIDRDRVFIVQLYPPPFGRFLSLLQYSTIWLFVDFCGNFEAVSSRIDY